MDQAGTCEAEVTTIMKKTRLSLFYLGSYLTIIGLAYCLLRTIHLSFFCPTEITAMCSLASREC